MNRIDLAAALATTTVVTIAEVSLYLESSLGLTGIAAIGHSLITITTIRVAIAVSVTIIGIPVGFPGKYSGWLEECWVLGCCLWVDAAVS